MLFSLIVYISSTRSSSAFGLCYIYRLLREGPADEGDAGDATAGRPLAVAAQATQPEVAG